ncbi:MAG: hypothetical protein M0R32_09635 [Candidatus Cloacimonetes bacterium]|jgi:hypothetical protein|nr:hypothetical protein [Candidatus Cloacimonadota bacterium]
MKNKSFGLSPARMRRACGGGFTVISKKDFGYELQYVKMKGTEITEIHSTSISKKLYKALKTEAKANFKMMAAIIGPEDKGLTP